MSPPSVPPDRAVDGEPPLLVDSLMKDVRARVAAELSASLVRRGGSPDFRDRDIFGAVSDLFQRGLDTRDSGALLLPDMFGDDEDWRVDAPLRLTSHRPAAGGVVLFFKKRLLLPLMRWLFEYSKDRFERQHRLNLAVFACLEVLAVENARLRRELEGVRPAANITSPAVTGESSR